MTLAEELYAEAMRSWEQNSIGTSATPPAEAVTQSMVLALAARVEELERRIRLMEAS